MNEKLIREALDSGQVVLKQDMGMGQFMYSRADTLELATIQLKAGMAGFRRRHCSGQPFTKEVRDYIMGVGKEYPPCEVMVAKAEIEQKEKK